MKSNEIQALNQVRDFFKGNKNLPKQMKDNMDIIFNTVTNLDQEVKQKERLLVQKEKELKAFRAGVDNSSKNTRDVINESKQHLDKAESLYKSGNFSEALKYANKALYSIGDIDSLEVKTVEQANKLYVERLELYKESEAKREYFYNSSVVNDKNAFAWVKDNPTRDFYSFFRDTLKVSDKSPENVDLIQNRLYKNLPLYIEEAQRANSFYNEYNKYYDAKIKLEQVANIYNIKGASSKGLKDYAEALKSCDIALVIDPTSATLLNLKNAILQEKQVVEAKKLEEERFLVNKDKLVSDQAKKIEILEKLLAQKDKLIEQQKIEKQDLLTQMNEELHNESLAKNEIIEDLNETIVLKDAKIEELSYIPVGIQIGGIEEASQTTGIALIGDDIDIALFH
ncbi:MAG: hypothetical protein LBQ34_04680 [Alphaproteobacteria bacterium]|jgi:tetratricopeptide (TPR) repeat protein|nr:hypothetical protein [Alphaproteobacteria bacterium]